MSFYIITVAIIIALGAMCLILCDNQDHENIMFLESYGWKVKHDCHERVNITIPEIFDNVYNNYNELQKLAGLDLSDYKGQDAIRYTYIVTNFPEEICDTVYANVICVKDTPIGGDVMTVPLDGFMFSLNYLKLKK